MSTEQPNMRDHLRRRVLSVVLGRIDNRRFFRDGVESGPTVASSPGPYFIADPPVRRDVREDREGLPLLLRIRTVDADTLEPLPGASVQICHCDAFGTYSGYQAYDPDKFSNVPLMARAFLDGVDLMTTEFYFPDEYSARVRAMPPYDRRGRSPFVNDNDIEIRMAKGSAGSWLDITETADGVVGAITVKVERAGGR